MVERNPQHSSRNYQPYLSFRSAIVSLLISCCCLSMPVNAQGPAAEQNASAGAAPTVDALGDPLPNGARLRLGTQRFRHPEVVAEMALSPDEKTVVTIGSQYLIVWDVATGKERWRTTTREHRLIWLGPAYGIHLIEFAGDSQRFYTPGNMHEVISWDTTTGEHELVRFDELELVQSPGGYARSLDLSPDEQFFAIGYSEGIAVCNRAGHVVFRVENKAVIRMNVDDRDRLKFGGDFGYARFSPAGDVLAVVTSDRPEAVRLFGSANGEVIREIPTKARVVRLAFSPDGALIAVTERDNAVRVYEVDSGTLKWEQIIELKHQHENYTSDVAVSPDGQIVVAAATDLHIYCFDSMTGEKLKTLVGHREYPWALAFTRDSSILYSCGWDGALRRWDIQAGKQLPIPAGTHASGVVAASTDGQTLAYCDDSGLIRLVNAQDGTELGTLELPGSNYSQLSFSRDGQRLAGGGTRGDQVLVAVWNVSDASLIHRWEWPKGNDKHSQVEALSFNLDGSRLAAAIFRQSAVYLWDAIAGEQIAQARHNQVYGLSFSPQGTLATAGWDKMLRFWNSDSGELIGELSVDTDAGRPRAIERDIKAVVIDSDPRMYAVSYAPRGDLMATAHLDGRVRVWKVSDMTVQCTVHLPQRFVYGAMSLSPDGLWLATGAADGSVDLWDAASGDKVLDVGKHAGYCYNVSFGKDSRSLVTGAEDGMCYVWNLRPAEVSQDRDLADVWKDFSGQDSQAAYQARWQLLDISDRTVDLIGNKLRPVKRVFNLRRVVTGENVEEAFRRKKLMVQLIDKEQHIEELTTIRRSIDLLAEMNTQQAKELLAELAQKQNEIGELASAALNRVQ